MAKKKQKDELSYKYLNEDTFIFGLGIEKPNWSIKQIKNGISGAANKWEQNHQKSLYVFSEIQLI